MTVKHLVCMLLCYASLHGDGYEQNTTIASGYKNPFEGFNNFVFMANFAGSTKHEVDKINTVIKKELSSFAEIKESSLIKTDQNGVDNIDFSAFNSGGFLEYSLISLTDTNGKDLKIQQATLSFKTSIEVKKTQHNCIAVIWYKTCFLKTQKNTASMTSDSLKLLLKDFQNEYSQVNEEKPCFNFFPS